MKPKVLLATTCRWFSAARLSMAFRDAGADVDMVCPAYHPVNNTGAVHQQFRYESLTSLRSFQNAILRSQPGIVVPCDDLATSILHGLHATTVREDSPSSLIRDVIERSLGNPEYYTLVRSRSRLIGMAKKLGIAAPDTCPVKDEGDLEKQLLLHEFPVLLKTDGTSGGVGVRVVHSKHEALKVFRTFSAPPNTLRMMKRAVINGDHTLVEPWLKRSVPVVNIQAYATGQDATLSVGCWKGEVIASICGEVLRTWKPMGPASVLRRTLNPEMLTAAQKLASTMGLTGLYGFDFILENGTGRPLLLEMNPRATQTCHLGLGKLHDIPAAIVAAATGKPITLTPSVIGDREIIALFPLEWQNDPHSPFIQSGYHDIPWKEPRLVEAGKQKQIAGWMTYENLDKALALLPWHRT